MKFWDFVDTSNMWKGLGMTFFIILGSYAQYKIDNLWVVLPLAGLVGLAVGHVCARAYPLTTRRRR